MKPAIPIYVLSAGIAFLAVVFGFLSFELSRLNQTLPEMTDEIRKARAAVQPALDEVQIIRRSIPDYFDRADLIVSNAVPPVLHEAERMRESIPHYLDRLESLATGMRQAGRQASEGAVAGVFTGILNAPRSLLFAIGDSLTGDAKLNDEEREVIAIAADYLLKSDQAGAVQPFTCPATGLSGLLERRSRDESRGVTRENLRIMALRQGQLLFAIDFELEAGRDGNWRLVRKSKVKN